MKNIPTYIKQEAINWVAMLNLYSSAKSYKQGWVWNMYIAKYPDRPLSKQEYKSAGKKKPTSEFKNWIFRYHRFQFDHGKYKPTNRVIIAN